ncbi:hexose transporter [Fusarium acutatum]|uniref:Hexose transporter n=1 Tax=Fusarium acutatum TaxID=78861 RepID=A0A8H4NHE3_9HYPO|nr:hexose transporter [Fusarium acutatum]
MGTKDSLVNVDKTGEYHLASVMASQEILVSTSPSPEAQLCDIVPGPVLLVPNGTPSWTCLEALGSVSSTPFTGPQTLGLYMGYLFLIAGATLQTAAHKPATFIAARGLLGIASGWYTSCAPLLINEIAFPTHKAIAAPCFQYSFYIGSLAWAWVAFGTRNYGSPLGLASSISALDPTPGFSIS